MKLVRYGNVGQEKPGLLDQQGNLRDLSGHISDICSETLCDESLSLLKKLDPADLPTIDGNSRLGSPIARPGKFIGIGLNYSDHAAEMNMDPPSEPIVFLKASSSICGPFDDYEMPYDGAKLDWEVELGVVIGKRAKRVSQAEAMDHIAGFCTVNDGSERVMQLERGGQWTKGKSHDSFGPVGPWLVTKDEVPDISDIPMHTDVNGERMQDGSTRTLIFSIPEIIAYLSNIMTLEPGDFIATGTPPGVGGGQKPVPVFLEIGDVLELEVKGLGLQRHQVVAAV